MAFTEEEASKKACELLRKHFVGLDHANIVAAGDDIVPYDDAYIIRNYPDEWYWFMQGWKYASGQRLSDIFRYDLKNENYDYKRKISKSTKDC